MKKRNVFVASVLFAGLTFVGCKKDEPATKSPAENKQTMSSTTTTAQSDIKEFAATPGVKAVGSFASTSKKDDPFSSLKGTGHCVLLDVLTPETLVSWLSGSKLKSTVSETRFDFAGSAGTYTWNQAANKWDEAKGSPSNKIVVKFPADTTKPSVNNGVLEITKYQDTQVGGSYEPTAMEASVTVDNAAALSLSYSAAYKNGLPTMLKLTLSVNPFSFNINYAEGGATQSIATSLKNGDKVLFGVEGSINYLTEAKDSVISITGIGVTYRDIKLKGDAKIADLMKEAQTNKQSTDFTALINKHCVFAMYRTDDDTKMGDIVAVQDAAGDMDFKIKYSDTESESLKTYVENIGKAVEADVKNLTQIFSSYAPI